LGALLAEALPPETAGESRRASELDAWGRAIEAAIDRARHQRPQADGAALASRRLRALLDVNAESLEPIPLGGQNPDWRGYLERQLSRWRELAKGRDGDWADLGLKDAAAASRHLGYLAEYALLRGNLPRWLRENLGHLTEPLEAIQARRLLAVRLGELICFGVDGRPPHRGFEAAEDTAANVLAGAIQPRLRGYAQREQHDAEERDDRHSPHYLGFIAPFLKHLAAVKAAPATARKPQPGDKELALLVEGLAARGAGGQES
jgi:hypothetical protein